ncbi:MAG TPA: diacylglycerol kinase, partial [Myxococcales bacterium]|nr:diacylglycerol kinase [Myxococcales bacterium]
MPPRARGLFGSFKHAYEGLIHTVVNQRNMKVHVVSALLVAMVGSGIVLDLATKATLIFCVLLVFFAEILNTALEALVDLHIDEFDERARVTKDAAAAGVLVLAIGTVAIFAAVIVTHWPLILESGDRVLRQVVVGGPLVALGGLLLWRARRAVWLDVLASVA